MKSVDPVPVMVFSLIGFYLNAGFWQPNFGGHFFTHENVGILGLFEKLFQKLQLVTGESRPLTALFSWIALKNNQLGGSKARL